MKELTRIRLEREAREKKHSEAQSVRSETSSDSDSASINKAPASGYFATAINATTNIRRGVATGRGAMKPVTINSSPYSNDSRRSSGRKHRDRNRHARPGMSDTSSNISVSSGSTDTNSDRGVIAPIIPAPAPPEPWNPAVASPYASSLEATPDQQITSSAIGSVIRQILSVDVSAPVIPPPPVEEDILPTSWGENSDEMNPISPKSLKNRPQIYVECPGEIRRRSRTDSLVYEVMTCSKLFLIEWN